MATNGDEREIDTVTLRATAVAWRFRSGWTPTTREVAELCVMEEKSAWAMLSRMSDVIPIYLDRTDLRWHVADDGQQKRRCHYVVMP